MSCCRTVYHICQGVPNCLETLEIKTPIISDTILIVFHDKFGRNYRIVAITDVDGIASIDLATDLPTALLNEFAGDFRIVIYDSENAIVKYTISGVEYDGIVIHVENVTHVMETFVINPFTMDGFSGMLDF